jgi:hypothetical protein
MSRTLALIGAGWASVRSSAKHGQRSDTLNRLRCLLARPDLPAPVASEAHRLAGDLLVETGQYREARRHLRLAAGDALAEAKVFYLWGLAFERDPHGCDRHAARLFRKASKLEPANATYRAAFGRAAVRCGRFKVGVRELLLAATATPGDLGVIRVVTEGLIEAGQLSAAESILQKARFLCFESGKDRELAKMSERVRYEFARQEQKETKRHRQDAELATDGGRLVLPFVRVRSSSMTRVPGSPKGHVRRDVVSLPKPHFPRLRVRRAD